MNSWKERYYYRGYDTNWHNTLAASRRLMKGGGYGNARETICTNCGESCWQYPEPQYWMQYPLSEFLLLDGKSCCSMYCVERLYFKQPVKAGTQFSLFN